MNIQIIFNNINKLKIINYRYTSNYNYKYSLDRVGLRIPLSVYSLKKALIILMYYLVFVLSW
jgi:hypothetical protein